MKVASPNTFSANEKWYNGEATSIINNHKNLLCLISNKVSSYTHYFNL